MECHWNWALKCGVGRKWKRDSFCGGITRKILVVDRKHGHNQRGGERRSGQGGLAEP